MFYNNLIRFVLTLSMFNLIAAFVTALAGRLDAAGIFFIGAVVGIAMIWNRTTDPYVNSTEATKSKLKVVKTK